MRVAFSGSHRVGKSTLLDAVSQALPDYVCVEEPYLLLEDDEYDFADPPSTEDFEAQLRRSLLELRSAGRRVLFDRCPADFLAYLLVDGNDVDRWLEFARRAMTSLDLVVFVPIEEPDRVAIASHEHREQRRAVDQTLAELLDDEFAVDTVVVHGDVTARCAQVMARVHGAPA